MTFLRDILSKGFPPKIGLQGLSGTSNPVQGVQGGQGIQGITGYQSGTLLVNTQSGRYNLQSSDVGKVVTGINTVGISSNIFNPGESVIILNNSGSQRIQIDINSPAITLYEDGLGLVSSSASMNVKSFAYLLCTKLNQFVISLSKFEPIVATGGTIIDIGLYRVHIFTGTDIFSITKIPSGASSTLIEYVVIAGGGNGNIAGGGAGGFRTGTFTSTVENYLCSVGGGTSPSSLSPYFSSPPTPINITSAAGGNGGFSGGSGGGGGLPNGAGAAGNTPPTTPPQGNPGGSGGGPTLSGEYGGGGGAGASGSPAPPIAGGAGGNGAIVEWSLPTSYGSGSPSPTGRYFAGGGGGAPGPSGGPTGGNGGQGGGGPGAFRPGSGTPGTVNTGGGGGGGQGGTQGSGGSGIIMIRYIIR